MRATLAMGLLALVPTLLAAQQPKAPSAMDKMDQMAVAKGTFVGADGHPVAGSYQITKMAGQLTLTTSADFSVDPRAPDVYVVLSNAAKVGKDHAVWLGKITGHTGAQIFVIPAAAKLEGMNQVVLWCKRYAATIGTASLDLAGLMHDSMEKDAMALRATPAPDA